MESGSRKGQGVPILALRGQGPRRDSAGPGLPAGRRSWRGREKQRASAAARCRRPPAAGVRAAAGGRGRARGHHRARRASVGRLETTSWVAPRGGGASSRRPGGQAPNAGSRLLNVSKAAPVPARAPRRRRVQRGAYTWGAAQILGTVCGLAAWGFSQWHRAGRRGGAAEGR